MGLKIIPLSVQRPSSAVEARPIGYEGAWGGVVREVGSVGSGGENSLTRLAYGGLQVPTSAMSARGRRRCDARRRGISLVGLKVYAERLRFLGWFNCFIDLRRDGSYKGRAV